VDENRETEKDFDESKELAEDIAGFARQGGSKKSSKAG